MTKKVTYTDIDGNSGEVDADKLSFRPSVYGIIIEDNKILLSKQWDGYDFPGGGVEIHETLENALKREVWEETGLKVTRGEMVTCESSFFKSVHGEKYYNSILIYYVCQKIGGELSKNNFNFAENEYLDMPEWVDLSEIENIKFYNSIDSIEIIKKACGVIESNIVK